jgi:SAM-dependent methyltransferase
MQTDPSRQTTQTYDEIAPQFADRVWGIDPSDQLDRFCACLRPGARVVDLGCGPGRDTLSLTGRGFWTVGLDRSAGMLRQAAARGARRLVQADVRALLTIPGTRNASTTPPARPGLSSSLSLFLILFGQLRLLPPEDEGLTFGT